VVNLLIVIIIKILIRINNLTSIVMQIKVQILNKEKLTNNIWKITTTYMFNKSSVRGIRTKVI